MPKNQRYTGTAVIERNSVPIRNELTSQLTRWKGICGNMMLVDYSARTDLPIGSREIWSSRPTSAMSPQFVGISHIILDVQLFQNSIGRDRDRAIVLRELRRQALSG